MTSCNLSNSPLCTAALPFVANFTAGAIAGISEILTFYPLGELVIKWCFTVCDLYRRCCE